MTCPQLLFVWWCSSILAVTSCIRVDGYSCVSAYWNMVTCVLNITDNPVGRSNTTYSLKFIDLWGKDPISCPLVVMNHSYSCVCELMDDSDHFMDIDEYGIKLCHESGCLPVIEKFLPSKQIQLTPPHKVEIQETPDTVNVTLKSGYEGHRYLNDGLDYELLLQTSQSSRTLHSKSNQFQGSISIPRSELKPNATYCLKVRSIPNKGAYKGTWSEWSPSTCWKNEAGEKQVNILVILIKSLGPVCVAVGVLLFVFYGPAARMKIKTLSHTPSPAPFFQPLFQQHEGNFQEWFSPRGRFVLTYKAEEILKTDAVNVVPNPITKEPEENQDFHNLPVTQLVFPQCQSSYVGLPGVHEAPPPLTLVCPGDMSYTQLPCSVWGVGIGEVEVPPPLFSSPPKDLFNISREDSGCEDLTQSPECSVLNSPVDDSPPPCYCSDYCILNKTAEGFAPVLVSRGNNLNDQSDSPQEGES
ncbi:interleukin-21 receptor-like [Epinephelus fuscoguttatus]|uniref:interleukin-21 receptor-like n=1 Tax=Epinephelus fuscoguttatus TaxID=293821 RepID=UPI0020D1CDE4|nr:interleukin-21 receptor-like [Epinephelus fuscoguttatus]